MNSKFGFQISEIRSPEFDFRSRLSDCLSDASRGMGMSRRHVIGSALAAACMVATGGVAWGGADPPPTAADVDRAVGLGFAYLQKQQAGDGSFDGESEWGIEVSARALLAFLGAGHVPELGKYGLPVRNVVDWLLAQQGSKGSFVRRAGTSGSIPGRCWHWLRHTAWIPARISVSIFSRL